MFNILNMDIKQVVCTLGAVWLCHKPYGASYRTPKESATAVLYIWNEVAQAIDKDENDDEEGEEPVRV